MCLLALALGAGPLHAQTTDDTLAVLRAAVEWYEPGNGKPTVIDPLLHKSCGIPLLANCVDNGPPPDSAPSPVVARLASERGLPLRVAGEIVRCSWADGRSELKPGMILYLGRPMFSNETAIVSISVGCRGDRWGFGEGCTIRLARHSGSWAVVPGRELGCFIT